VEPREAGTTESQDQPIRAKDRLGRGFSDPPLRNVLADSCAAWPGMEKPGGS